MKWFSMNGSKLFRNYEELCISSMTMTQKWNGSFLVTRATTHLPASKCYKHGPHNSSSVSPQTPSPSSGSVSISSAWLHDSKPASSKLKRGCPWIRVKQFQRGSDRHRSWCMCLLTVIQTEHCELWWERELFQMLDYARLKPGVARSGSYD